MISCLSKVVRLPLWLASAGLVVAIFIFPAEGVVSSPVERVIRIEASRFAYAPAQVRGNPGDQVTLEVVAQDVAHGIQLDGYDLEVFAEPGQTARLAFVANQAGTFRFRCSVTCGPLHPFMIGKLMVGQNWLLIKSMLASVMVGILAVVYRYSGKLSVHA